MMMGVWKRQMIVGIIAIIIFIIGEATLLYINLQWGADWMMFTMGILVPIVGVAFGSFILFQGIKGKRLKEEREFRTYNGFQP